MEAKGKKRKTPDVVIILSDDEDSSRITNSHKKRTTIDVNENVVDLTLSPPAASASSVSASIADNTSFPTTSTVSSDHRKIPPLILPEKKSPRKESPLAMAVKCPVCMDDEMTEPASTVCGHLACYSCIKSCIKNNGTCPICRKKLRGKNSYHRLYI